MTERNALNGTELLASALCWLRNHYEHHDRTPPEMRKKVLERIDAILANNEPTAAGMQSMRALYPIDILENMPVQKESDG